MMGDNNWHPFGSEMAVFVITWLVMIMIFILQMKQTLRQSYFLQVYLTIKHYLIHSLLLHSQQMETVFLTLESVFKSTLNTFLLKNIG